METPTFVPAVTYRDPKGAIAWLTEAFGFELTMAIEGPGGDPAQSHYEMDCAGSGRIMIGAAWEDRMVSPLDVARHNTQIVHVRIDSDVDAHCATARAAGGEVVMEPADQFYGDRVYRVVDHEGHCWVFSQPVREVSRAEAEAAIGVPIHATAWD